MKKVKWGILGPGKIARSFASDFQFVKSGELVAVGSRSPERAVAFADEFDIPRRYGSYEGMLADPDIDAIYIATPHKFHFEQTKACLIAGKSVLCEKPITTSPTQLKELISLHASTEHFLMEGMWTYFLPAIKKAKEWVDNGSIGTVKSVNATFGFAAKFDPDGRLFNPELAGGAVFDIGIYPIAIALFFLGEHPAEIKSDVHLASTGVDDDVKIELKYANGSSASLHCSLLEKLENTAEIIGENGRIVINDFWMSRECSLHLDDGSTSSFKDDRESQGYDFETEAACQDILAGRKQSGVVALHSSESFQQIISRILN